MSHVPDLPTAPLAAGDQAPVTARPVERVVLYGEPGTHPEDARAGEARVEGARVDDLEALMQRAWANLFEAMRKAGFEKRHLVMTTVCVTEGGQFKLFRVVRDRMMQGHLAASAYLHMSGPGAPAHQVKIEGEVLRARS
jgi:enamine deaminase RidA (YjgF/YER057c/UK114 family)